jgi:hypothetical protein
VNANGKTANDPHTLENAEDATDAETMPSHAILERVRENHQRIAELCAENHRLLGIGGAVTRGAGPVVVHT